jgi:hypothetical protein
MPLTRRAFKPVELTEDVIKLFIRKSPTHLSWAFLFKHRHPELVSGSYGKAISSVINST